MKRHVETAWNGPRSAGIVSASMLPVTFQFIIATVAYSLNERMARRLEYLQEEARVLKEALAVASGV